jgi:RND family efflux transporter MFP subunit
MFDPKMSMLATALLAMLLLPGCNRADSAGPGGPEGPPAVAVAPVTQRSVQQAEDFSARLEAAETVALRSRVAGTLNQVHFKDGERVARGALLFSIDPRPYAAEVSRGEAQLAATRTQVDLAKAELARAEKLLPMQAVSQQEIDQLRASVKSGEANAQAAQAALNQAQLNLGYTRIVAPVAGRLSRANVTAGNLVGVGEPVLTTLVAADRIHAWFDASEATLLRLQAAQRAGAPGATVLMGLDDEDGLPHKGTIDFIDNRLDPATGSIRMRAAFANPTGRFVPGLSARLRLISGAPTLTATVPERAIATDQTRKTVLVVGANNIVAPREVKLGALLGGMRAVSGVKAGETIIVDGLQRAFPGAPVTPQLLKVDAEGMPIPPPPPAGGPGAGAPAGK